MAFFRLVRFHLRSGRPLRYAVARAWSSVTTNLKGPL